MEIVVRAPRLGFGGVPRHWFARSAAATHLVNGVNLLFPAGERFFVRTVHRYLDRLENAGRADLALRVRGFFGQEGRHAQAHERFFDTMREQGYAIDGFLERYEHVAYGVIEKHAPEALSLAVTVALEHFTAMLAEDALADGSPLVHADERMRRLLEWHALEELEHKSVAFDVLAAVHPSYSLRMAGLAVAGLCLGGFWLMATKELLAQDGVSVVDAMRELARLRARARRDGREDVSSIGRRVFLRGVARYMRPRFHPDDEDHRDLVERTLGRLAREGVVVTDVTAQPT